MISFRRLIPVTKIALGADSLKVTVDIPLPLQQLERWIGSLVLPSGFARGSWTLKSELQPADKGSRLRPVAAITHYGGSTNGRTSEDPDRAA